MRIFLSCLSVMILAGCFYDPSYMPNSYSKSRESLKALDAPYHEGLDYEYSALANDQVLKEWEVAVVSLVDAGELKGLFQRDGVYIAPPEVDNAFTLTFDHVLRQELRHRGYPVGIAHDVRGAVYTMVELHDNPASLVKDGGSSYERVDNDHARVALGLSLGTGEMQRAYVMQESVVPLYGYNDSLSAPYGWFSKNLTDKTKR